MIPRPDRDELRSEIRQLLGADAKPAAALVTPAVATQPHQLDASGLKLAAEEAGRGRTLLP